MKEVFDSEKEALYNEQIELYKRYLKAIATKIERVGFSIDAPNPQTPQLIQLASEIRRAAAGFK